MAVLKFLLIAVLFVSCNKNDQTSGKRSPIDSNKQYAIIEEIDPPAGFVRQPVDSNSFAFWLRHLPLKTEDNMVHLYNGSLKHNQNAQFRVIAMDVGNEDLQQCADAVIRLRSEYLYRMKRYREIAFNFTSGDRAEFLRWAEGYRPMVNNNRVTWVKKSGAKLDLSYSNFREYLDSVFMYAGSYSLSKELATVKNVEEVRIGDVFIQGGFPGHAIIVVDLAINKETNKKAMLLAQSYMPAQEIHILKNPKNEQISPWYIVKQGEMLVTPQWIFSWTDLKRFR